jgi:hypothetical protein
MRGLVGFTLCLAVTLPGGTTAADNNGAACTLVEVSHQTDESRTRVILRATAPIDYRGGRLHGDQVILDLANMETSLGSPVVELHAPEAIRLVIGPEISRDGERLLKVRLTGVSARSHKVTVNGNELYIDLTPRDGSRRREKGFPKLIRNDTAIVT